MHALPETRIFYTEECWTSNGLHPSADCFRCQAQQRLASALPELRGDQEFHRLPQLQSFWFNFHIVGLHHDQVWTLRLKCMFGMHRCISSVITYRQLLSALERRDSRSSRRLASIVFSMRELPLCWPERFNTTCVLGFFTLYLDGFGHIIPGRNIIPKWFLTRESTPEFFAPFEVHPVFWGVSKSPWEWQVHSFPAARNSPWIASWVLLGLTINGPPSSELIGTRRSPDSMQNKL